MDDLLGVADDEQQDLLTGAAGTDLFYGGLDDRLTDVKKKKNPGDGDLVTGPSL